jgi:predicted Zn-dependent peptidase
MIQIDGVPVYWADVAGPLSAGLVFGCGTRDETFMTIGITHLIEHLAMSTLPRLHHEHNASVDLVLTEFTATGRPEQIVEFVGAVCRALTSLPVDRLAQEAGVLAAENGFAVHPTGAALLTRRYGARDVGLESYAGPGVGRLKAETVLAYAARFFTTANAALWLSGPPPEGLRLPLPPGEPIHRTEPVPFGQDGPRWSQEMAPASGLLLSGARSMAWTLAMSVLSQRVRDDARHKQGISYTVFGEVIPTGRDSRQFLLGADAREGHDGTVAEILWQHTVDLANNAPTEEEVAQEKAAGREMYDDPRWPGLDACYDAQAAVLGLSRADRATRLTELETVTADDISAVVRQSLATALIVVPPEVSPKLPGVADGGCVRTRTVPNGQRFAMRWLVRLIGRQWKPPTLYLTPTGMARRDGDGDVHETAFLDVIGVEVAGDNRLVFAANGCLLPVIRDAYRGGQALIQAIDTAVPAHLFYSPDDSPLPTQPATGAPAPGVPAPDAPAPVGRARRWPRVLNGLGAVGSALAAAVLYFDWRTGRGSVWWVAGSVGLALWCAWDARPPRRSKPPVL